MVSDNDRIYWSNSDTDDLIFATHVCDYEKMERWRRFGQLGKRGISHLYLMMPFSDISSIFL